MPDNGTAEKAAAYISSLMEKNDSCGGIIECIADGLPAGLGEPVFDKIDALLGQTLFSVGAVKGVEIGDGFEAAGSTGSRNNDPFHAADGRIEKLSNHSGGTLGGLSDGSRLIIRAAIKPTPSIAQLQKTVNKNGEIYARPIGDGGADSVFVDRLRLVTFENPRYITKQGSSLYKDSPVSGPAVPAEGGLRPVVSQGFVEASNVNVVNEMVQMIEINRAYEAGQKTIQAEETMVSRLWNEIVRVGR